MQYTQLIAVEFAQFILKNYIEANTKPGYFLESIPMFGNFLAEKYKTISQTFMAPFSSTALKEDKISSARRFFTTLQDFALLDLDLLDPKQNAEILRERLKKFLEGELANATDKKTAFFDSVLQAILADLQSNVVIQNSDDYIRRILQGLINEELQKIRKIEERHDQNKGIYDAILLLFLKVLEEIKLEKLDKLDHYINQYHINSVMIHALNEKPKDKISDTKEPNQNNHTNHNSHNTAANAASHNNSLGSKASGALRNNKVSDGVNGEQQKFFRETFQCLMNQHIKIRIAYWHYHLGSFIPGTLLKSGAEALISVVEQQTSGNKKLALAEIFKVIQDGLEKLYSHYGDSLTEIQLLIESLLYKILELENSTKASLKEYSSPLVELLEQVRVRNKLIASTIGTPAVNGTTKELLFSSQKVVQNVIQNIVRNVVQNGSQNTTQNAVQTLVQNANHQSAQNVDLKKDDLVSDQNRVSKEHAVSKKQVVATVHILTNHKMLEHEEEISEERMATASIASESAITASTAQPQAHQKTNNHKSKKNRRK